MRQRDFHSKVIVDAKDLKMRNSRRDGVDGGAPAHKMSANIHLSQIQQTREIGLPVKDRPRDTKISNAARLEESDFAQTTRTEV